MMRHLEAEGLVVFVSVSFTNRHYFLTEAGKLELLRQLRQLQAPAA
jgi:hypothetical protein